MKIIVTVHMAALYCEWDEKNVLDKQIQNYFGLITSTRFLHYVQ